MRVNYSRFNKDKILLLDDFFIIPDNIFENSGGNSEFSVVTSLKQKKSMSLNSFLSYIFYLKTPFLFIDNDNETTPLNIFLELLKNQMGKDIYRDDRTVNGENYNQHYFLGENRNNYQIADMFYSILISKFSKQNVDFDLINKIMLLSCQNMFNMITDLITMKVYDMLYPEMCSVFRPTKSAKITINKRTCLFEYFFTSKLIISQKGKSMDPEFPCGNITFHMTIDLLKGIFELSELKLDYNLNKCSEEEEEDKEDPKKPINKLIYPAIGLGIAGIASIPFLLGGKFKKYSKKRNKKR
jgi:hypothetical protein